MTHRRSIRGRRHAVASFGALLAFLSMLAGAPTVLAAPALDVTPSSGLVGATLTATATEFPADGPVTFRWDNGQLLGNVTANAQGTAQLQFSIPATAPLGAHFVRACSTNKCPQGTVFADATVTVVAPTPPPTPTPSPTPIPTATPTRTPTPTPRPPTPGPSTPGQTPAPNATPTPPGSTATPASLDPTIDPSGGASAAPTASAAISASPAASIPPVIGPVESPTSTPLAVDPTGGGLASLAVPGGVLVLLFVVGILLVRMRRLAPRASPAVAVTGADASLDAAPEPDAFSALHDPVAPFLEPIAPAPPSDADDRTQIVVPSGDWTLATDAPSKAGPPRAEPPTPSTPDDGTRRPRTISIHVEQIEADDL